MNCSITVINANGLPIAGANVTLDDSYKVTDSNGTARLITVREERSTLTVYHPDYARETVHFDATITTGRWDNPVLEVRSGARSDDALLTMRLGRFVFATTGELSPNEMTILAKKNADIRGVLIETLQRDRRRKTYRGYLHDSKPVEVAAPVIVPSKSPPDEAAGWRRFETEPPPVPNGPGFKKPLVEVVDEGRFLWLLYPPNPHPGPQYAVLVWSPNINQDNPPDTLDMILFYSPTTEQPSYATPYPFGIQMYRNPKDPDSVPFPDQTYMSLGRKYLGEENAFYYQMVAQKRRAVLVMLICNYGDYGPTTRGEGVLRLCREVVLLLYREGLTTRLGSSSGGGRLGGMGPEETLAGATLRDHPFTLWTSKSSAPPAIGHVAVSFYSNSARPVKKLMQPTSYELGKGYERFDRRLWGTPGDSEDVWRSTWRELWDMDGWHPETGTWNAYLTLLSAWYLAENKRIVRLCHSSGRVPPDPDVDKHPIWDMLKGDGMVDADRRDIKGAHELHGKRWSIVRFDDGYVSHLPPGKDGKEKVGWQVPNLLPPLADAHQATPRVAFSHFLRMSELGT